MEFAIRYAPKPVGKRLNSERRIQAPNTNQLRTRVLTAMNEAACGGRRFAFQELAPIGW